MDLPVAPLYSLARAPFSRTNSLYGRSAMVMVIVRETAGKQQRGGRKCRRDEQEILSLSKHALMPAAAPVSRDL